MIKKILLAFFIIYNLAFIISPAMVHAQFRITQPVNGGVQVTSQTGEGLVQTIVGNVIIIFFTVAGLGAVIMLLWGAVEWILSAGDKEKLAKARGRIVNAIIGLVLIALAFVIIRIVGQIIGFNPLGNLTLPNIGGTAPVSQCTAAQIAACQNPGVPGHFTCVTTPGQGAGYRCI